ncbi:hypothetical protein [Miniimonas arenae]|uniref:hypothetical protein n=1 Tax=Miniimonas arenae TaxID=676201 RepID=UPI0028A676EB|nr:hypothetical protein [Miniimonas arenae]
MTDRSPDPHDGRSPSAQVRDLVTTAVAALVAAGVRPEVLGRPVPARRVLGVEVRRPRIVSDGDVWRLGSVLLLPDGRLALAGQVVRAREEVRRGYTAESTRARADLAAAASRGGVPDGVAVHLGWRLVDLAALDRTAPEDGNGDAAGPLSVRAGESSHDGYGVGDGHGAAAGQRSRDGESSDDGYGVGDGHGAAAGPLSVRDGQVLVAWSPSAAPVPLERYMRERVALAVDAAAAS